MKLEISVMKNNMVKLVSNSVANHAVFLFSEKRISLG